MTDRIRIAGIIRESIVDGKGLRFVVFGQGCPHHCPGCHNPQTHDFSGGKLVSIDSLVVEIKKNPLLQGVTFSGGEPFAQTEAFSQLAREIKATCRNLDITVYSGYTYEQLQNLSGASELLELCDYLIDGPFILEERDISLKFRGSRNQRYIDLNRTRQTGRLFLAAEKTIPARRRYQTA